MHLKASAVAALFSCSLAAAVMLAASASVSDPIITPRPDPKLLRKQNDARYVGWVYDPFSSKWTTEECPSDATYFQSGRHWACCPTEIAGCSQFRQGCVSGSMIYNGALNGVSTSITRAWYVHIL